MLDLLSNVPRHMRLVGVDASQVHMCRAEALQAADELPELPPCVVSGWMLPWGRLYGKLAPASQLRRQSGLQVLCSNGGPVYGGDVLVVAFSASQGEPEWFGILGQLLAHKAPSRIRRGHIQSFSDLHAQLYGTPPGEAGEEAASRAVAAMWLQLGKVEEDKAEADLDAISTVDDAGPFLDDFDVLSLCDTNAQWYVDTDLRPLGVGSRLAELFRYYRRVMLIGTSMGGFGALSHAHLAHTVAVFGPQTDLCTSHLRPGFGPEELRAATTAMRDSVQRALLAGARIEYHVAMEDHLVYARSLPLPQGSLIVHALYARIARVLERAGILAPLLVDLVAELQRDRAPSPRVLPASVAFAVARNAVQAAVDAAGVEEPLEPCAWDWTSDAEQVLLGKWDQETEGGLSFVRASGRQLLLLCQEAPKFGDWFCTHCWSHNDEQASRCNCCGGGCTGAQLVGPPWVCGKITAWGRGNCERERACSGGGGAGGGGGGSGVCNRDPGRCPRCGEEQRASQTSCCHKCGGPPLRHCVNCRSKQSSGHLDAVVDVWYCTRCWGKFDEMNEQLRKEIPTHWYVEGGQRWAWADEGGERSKSCGYIDFCRHGLLDTSWGKGVWELKGEDMDVAFGTPLTRRRLRRTVVGFRCIASSLAEGGLSGGSCASAGGWPLYGEPNSLGWFPRLIEHLSGLLPRSQLVRRNRRGLLRLLAALLSLAFVGLRFRYPRRLARSASNGMNLAR